MAARVSRESAFLLVKTSKIHGKGVFAKSAIPKGTAVIEYTGEKIPLKEGLKRDTLQKKKGKAYVFALNTHFCIDGSTGGDARYINHSCTPNCIYVRKNGKIWIQTLRNIKTGEEITYDYDDAEGTHPCRCGAKKCKRVM